MTLKLSNVDKIYWPKEKISKGEMLSYYASIAPHILPYLKDRPIVMRRFPNGIDGESFYQKEAGEKLPPFVKTFPIQHTEKKIKYIVIQNEKTLLYVANLGSIELHAFSSRIQNIEKPDYLVFDLDPEEAPFKVVIDAALALHEFLDELGVPHFPKTSGASGLHVYVPLKAKYEYRKARQFADIIADEVHRRIPDITSRERLPQKRRRKIYIDTLQNVKGQTLAAAYSVRARPHATVSTPLSWKEVKAGLDPEDFTIRNVKERIAKKGDLFKGVLGKGADLVKALKKFQPS